MPPAQGSEDGGETSWRVKATWAWNPGKSVPGAAQEALEENGFDLHLAGKADPCKPRPRGGL